MKVFGALVGACGDHVVELVPCGSPSVYVVDCDGLLIGDVDVQGCGVVVVRVSWSPFVQVVVNCHLSLERRWGLVTVGWIWVPKDDSVWRKGRVFPQSVL